MSARIEHITRARTSKRPRRCDFFGCEHEDRVIQVGESYKKFSANRFAPTLIRHDDHPDWRRSEMETTKLATAYGGQESAADALDAIEVDHYILASVKDNDGRYNDGDVASDIESALDDAKTAAEECAGEYQEGIDNLPENLQESSPSAEMAQERIDALETWQSDLDGWQVDTDWDPEESDDAEGWDERDDRFREWVQAQIDSAHEALDALEV